MDHFYWGKLMMVSIMDHLRALLNVCGRCSFGGLGCCSCRVCVCVCVGVGGVVLCLCVCDLLIFLPGACVAGWLSAQLRQQRFHQRLFYVKDRLSRLPGTCGAG